MNFQWIDWTIVWALVVGMIVVAAVTKRYMRSVADFLAANRCAGRYLLAVSDSMAGLGAVSVVGLFQIYYQAGFAGGWWGNLMIPISLFVVLSGWVLYRFRETRALTMGQFFEIRYSKKFRIFAGILAWVAGVVNFGIFPAVGARFFIHFCGLPATVPYLGWSTYVCTMIVLLAISVYCVFAGGQITVMITDFIQGVFVYVVCLLILGVFIYMFNWSDIVDALKTTPTEASLIHPFHTDKIKNFNVWYYVIAAFTSVYAMGAFQGQQSGRTISAKSAHEAKMARIMGEWRAVVRGLLIMLLPLGAYTVMHHKSYTDVATTVNTVLETIDNPEVRNQMTVPMVLSVIMPTGILGLFAAVMMAAFISTHDTYLHSWGTIFVQDVVLPFRKKPFTPKQHILLLRLSILMVAVIIFFFSLYYRQNEHIVLFMAVTGALFTGGAGSAIIGGLYWKRGTALGAWLAVFVGLVICVGCMIMRYFWVDDLYPWLMDSAPDFLAQLKYTIEGVANRVPWINWQVGPDDFPIDGMWVSFLSSLAAIVIYIACALVAWLVFKHPTFNMDRLLHRGDYAVSGDHVHGVVKPVTGWRTFLPTKEFSRGDRVIYYFKFFWSWAWFAVFIGGTIYNLTHEVSDDAWATYWLVTIVVSGVIGVGTAIWFSVGGILDVRNLFRLLSTAERDDRDMGMVIDHHSLEDNIQKPLTTDDQTANDA